MGRKMNDGLNNLIDRFDRMTADMDIPETRRHDWYWLRRNLGVRNSNHKHYQLALTVLKGIFLWKNSTTFTESNHGTSSKGEKK